MPDLERIQQNTPGTLSQQWYEDGVAVDPGTVTIGITRADGTVLVAAGTATTGSGTGARTYNLTTTHTALLDALKVTWTSTLKGTLVSYVEVVGGFLFSLSEARALTPLNNTTTYTTAALVDMRTRVEQAIEDACSVAFVPRYTLETTTATSGYSYAVGGYSYGPGGYGPNGLVLKWPMVRAVRSVTDAGTALTASQLSGLQWSESGILYGYGWTPGYGTAVVGYEHGWDRPPERVKRAALLLAKSWLVAGPVDDRTSTFSSADGGTYSLVVPGRGGSIFGVPEVDATVQQYSLQAGVA